MTTTVIVICAGEATRWAGHTGVPKHLVAPEGERLVDRTVRLAREHGASAVYVVSRPGDDRYRSPGALRVDARLEPENYDADKFLSSQHLWSTTGRTVIAYGDVWFDESAMATILADGHPDWRLYCRFGPSPVTGARAGECFAIGFWPRHHGEFRRALHRVARLRRTGVINRCGGWETYRAMHGAPDYLLRTHRRYTRHLEITGGWTEDFDTPRDYDTWLARRRRLVTVIVPWRGGDGDRDAAWAWVRSRWQAVHPTWDLVVGEHTTGPWCKARAVAAALPQVPTGVVVVVADADVWCPGVADAVDAVFAGAGWAIPHDRVHRLDAAATRAVLAGGPLGGTLTQAPYTGIPGGGITVLPRETLVRVPLDPRFVGWGQEDQSWGLALETLAGRPWRGTARLWHLWHTPQDRLNRHVGSREGHALHVRYQMARRHPERMRDLLLEAAQAQASDAEGVMV